MATFKFKFQDDPGMTATFTDQGSQMASTFEGAQVIETGDYNKLTNKPSINEVELRGNKTFEDLGDHIMTNIEIKNIFNRVFRS